MICCFVTRVFLSISPTKTGSLLLMVQTSGEPPGMYKPLLKNNGINSQLVSLPDFSHKKPYEIPKDSSEKWPCTRNQGIFHQPQLSTQHDDFRLSGTGEVTNPSKNNGSRILFAPSKYAENENQQMGFTEERKVHRYLLWILDL